MLECEPAHYTTLPRANLSTGWHFYAPYSQIAIYYHLIEIYIKYTLTVLQLYTIFLLHQQNREIKMFETLPNIKITSAQMDYLKLLKSETGSAYAVTVRSLIQKALDKEIADNTVANQLENEA